MRRIWLKLKTWFLTLFWRKPVNVCDTCHRDGCVLHPSKGVLSSLILDYPDQVKYVSECGRYQPKPESDPVPPVEDLDDYKYEIFLEGK